MLLDLLDLDNLLALPTAGQHRAFLPVVDVQRLLVEGGIGLVTEVASVVGYRLLVFFFLLVSYLLLGGCGGLLGRRLLSAAAADVGLDDLLLLRDDLLCLLSWSS